MAGWTGDLFLINTYYNHPDPDTDHIGYTSPNPWATNYFYSLFVTSTTVVNATDPLRLTSNYAIVPPDTLRSVSTVYDPQWNVSWWIASNFTVTTVSPYDVDGAVYVARTSISWVNHATGEIAQYTDASLGKKPFLTDIIYVDSRQLIFYGNGTRLYYTPRSNHPFGPSKFQPGLVNFISIPGLAIHTMLHLTDSDTLLLGCSLGNVLELDLSTFTIIAANRWGADPTIGSGSTDNIAWLKRDTAHPNVLYIGSQVQGYHAIGRMYLDNRLRFSYYDVPSPLYYIYNGAARSNYYPGRNMVFNANHSTLYLPGSGLLRQTSFGNVPFDSTSQPFYETVTGTFFSFQTHNCSVHTTCSDCQTDPDYCGWCPMSKSCTDSASVCPTEPWSQSYVCPVSTFASPSLVPAEGGVNATLYGVVFKTGLVCIFSQSGSADVSVNAAVVSDTSIACVVPPAVSMTGATKSLQVQVRDGLVQWGDPYMFSYVACSTFTNCSDCAGSTACGWCLGSNNCTYSTLCAQTTDVWTHQCPNIDSISPNAVSAFGGDVLWIATTSVLTTTGGYTYSVQFGSSAPVPALVTAKRSLTSSFQVTTPVIAATIGTQAIAVSLIRSPGSVIVASTSSSLSAYNCSTFSSCSTCFSAGPRCRWCSSINTCGDSSVVTGCGTSPAVCASVSAVTPNEVFLLNAASPLSITGLNLLSLPSSNLQCVFQSSTTSTQTTSATVTSATAATCPVINTPVAVYSLSLGYSGVPATNGIPYEVYNCSAAPCSSCVANGKSSFCNWCDDFGTTFGCVTSGTTCTTAITAPASCPIITSSTPNPVLSGVSTSVTLSGSFAALPVSGSTCVFSPSSGSPVSVATTTTSSTSVACTSTALAPAGAWTVDVQYNSTAYTPAANFTVFSCAVLTTCSTCASNSQCGWSNTGCVAQSAATINATSSCPVLTSVTPNVALRGGGDLVTVFGGPYVGGIGLYTCNFGVATSISSSSSATSVVCPVPATSISITTTLSIYTLGGAVPYSSASPLTFTYVDCPVFSSTMCSDACVSFPDANGNTLDGCGFCSVSGLCTSQSRCSDLWVPQCFKSVNLWPRFALLDGNDAISVAVSKHPELPIGQTILPTDFLCVFGSISTTATLVSQGNESIIECPAPVSNPSTTTFNINYRSHRFTDPISFTFANCAAATDCTSCLAMSPCGWCMDTQSCTTPTRCPLNNYTSTMCPDLRAIIPSTGSLSGGDHIQLVGDLFIPSALLVVKFADQVLLPVFINNSTLQITSPAHRTAGSVSVELWYNGSKYAATSQLFTYQKYKSNVVGIAVGLSLGLGFLLAIVIVIAVILYRRKAKGLLFNIKEPDYQLVAFGANTELAYRMPDDDFQFLETVLGRYNFAMQVAMSAVAPPTEEDLIAKSMLYVAQARGQSVGMINALVRGEIGRCKEENTIFRNNSVASKSFKFYSRVVGIPYLWKCMARVIYELEVLGNRTAKEQEKSTTDQHSTSLLRMTMEVDMDRYAGESNGGGGGSAADVDAEVNSLQLKLTCQKLFSVLVKNGVSDIPAEFRKIFVEIDSQIMKKFNNDMAVYKAIGGFFFLRFVCPAITAPHYYGLLTDPPNETTQRQLVLISKVIQSLANMQMPGRKETYMESMSDFIEKNMGAVVKFYQDMREASRVDIGAAASMDVPDDVRLNALAGIWEFCISYQGKLQTEISQNTDPADRDALSQDFQALLQQYPTKPKKSGDAASSKVPRSKKKRNTKDSTV